jgi:hypothetical protein
MKLCDNISSIPDICANEFQVNFDNIAKQCGIKYARNARAKFKDIMKKLSSNCPSQLNRSANPAESVATMAKPMARKGTRGVARTTKVKKARGRVGNRVPTTGKTITRRGRSTKAVNYEESDDEKDDVKMEEEDGDVDCDDDGADDCDESGFDAQQDDDGAHAQDVGDMPVQAQGNDEEFQDARDYRAKTPDCQLSFDDDEPSVRQGTYVEQPSVLDYERPNGDVETFFRISKAAREANIRPDDVPEAIENAKAKGFESVADYLKDIGPFCSTPGRHSIDEDAQSAHEDADEDVV